MSAWQSFFNQLSKPVRNDGNLKINQKICRCNNGALIFCGKNSYQTQGNCTLNLVCSNIQIDKHRANSLINYSVRSEKSEITFIKEKNSKVFSIAQ